MSMPSRAFSVAAGAYVLVTAAAVTAMAVGLTSPTGKLDPGSAPVPQQGVIPPGGIAGPDQAPQSKEKSGPSQLSCHQWPTGVWTQTLDPSSPACRASWDNPQGNGGSTATGVNGSVITIGVPKVTPDVEKLLAWFNGQYQLYGRTVRAVSVGPISTSAQIRAAMASAREQNVFAVLDADIEASSGAVDSGFFVQQAAQAQLVGITPRPVGHSALLTSSGPFAWSVMAPYDVSARRSADLVCRSLKGNPAPGGGPRKFAVLASAGEGFQMIGAKPTGVAVEALKACGIDAPLFDYRPYAETSADGEMNATTIAALMKAGITTAITVDGNVPDVLMKRGREASYTPEWVLGGLGWSSVNFRNTPEEATKHIIVPLEGTPLSMAKPDIGRRVTQIAGIAPERMDAVQGAEAVYRSLDLLFAGVQGAGPQLTPASFAFGMETTHYPNVSTGETPMYQPRVGYALGDHYGERDVALGWWDASYSTVIKFPEGDLVVKGRLCLLDKGRRFDADHPFPTNPVGLYRECHTT